MAMKTRTREQGSALILSVVIALVIMGITGAYLAVSLITNKQTYDSKNAVQALFAAEAGASAYIAGLNANVKDPKVAAPTVATFPTSFNGASYTIIDTNPYLTNFRKLEVTGSYGKVDRRIEVILTGNPGGVFWNAIFAGNSSSLMTQAALGTNNPYTLSLTGGRDPISGQLVQDTVKGDVYSGGNFTATGQAILLNDAGAGTSTVTYAGTNNSTVAATYTNGLQASLNLPRDPLTGKSTWEETAIALRSGTRQDANGVTYIDVAYDLSTKGSYGSWIEGSSATQIKDVNEPAHLFRQNPTSSYGSTTDRTQNYEMTKHAKNDFYFEDPTTTQLGGLSTPAINGDTTATALNVAPNGNNAVYFIDGNMRVSAEPIKSYKLNPVGGTGQLQMTFVVKGNISLTDNILLPSYESQKDGVAYIALTDPAYPNTTAADFQKAGGSLLTAASGLTIDQFVTQFNATANSSGGRIAPLNFSNPADYDRAAQEYNKSYGSGNVYFGDPGSGTVEHFEGFMYAENNFYATNLDSTKSSGGTQKVEVFGNMTAGNEVKIQRDTTKAGYIPLHVTLDPIIKNASGPVPPALPSTPQYGAQPYLIASWRQLP